MLNYNRCGYIGGKGKKEVPVVMNVLAVGSSVLLYVRGMRSFEHGTISALWLVAYQSRRSRLKSKYHDLSH